MRRYGSAKDMICPKAGAATVPPKIEPDWGSSTITAHRSFGSDAGAKPDERGHVGRFGVFARFGVDLARRSGLARELVAGDRDLAGGAAGGEHALEHRAQLCGGRGGDHAVARGRSRAAAVDRADDVRAAQDAAVGDGRVGGAICIGVTSSPWPIGRLPIEEPEYLARGSATPCSSPGQFHAGGRAEAEAVDPRVEAVGALARADLDRPHVAGLGEDFGCRERLVGVFGVVVDRAVGDLDLVGDVEARRGGDQALLQGAGDGEGLEGGARFVVEADRAVLERRLRSGRRGRWR